MNIQATPKTAFYTGVWTALGMSSFAVFERLHPLGTSTHNIMFIVAAVLFLFIPVGIFVAGPEYFRFGIKDILSKEYLIAFRKVAFRGLFWFFGSAISLIVFGIIESYFAT